MKASYYSFFAALGVSLAAASSAAEFPKVWSSVEWGRGMDAAAADLAAHGVDVIGVPVWDDKVCREALAICRKHGLKAFSHTSEPSESSHGALAGRPYERSVFIGGAYRGKAIDRFVFPFTAEEHEIVIEPPVYSAGQPYGGKTSARSGHYFSASVPVRAEVVVALKPYDGRQHVKVIPVEVLPPNPGQTPENDTATEAMRGTPEIVNRRLVRLRFDLTPYKDALLDKVGIAVYWASDTESASWKKGRGQMSVFSESTRASAVRGIEFRLNRWKKSNGGTFPSDVIVGIRYGDEGFNVTGWVDCTAASYPLYGYSESGLAAFRRLAPELEVPRTWGQPEIYGAEAYGAFLYCFHKASAELAKAVVEAAHRIAPDIYVFRNTTRAGVWATGNDHDGTGQELLAEVLDVIHLDPYPVANRYNGATIPFDMGYMAGLARRFGKPLLPWMQAHSYAPCGLSHVTPEQIGRMWQQHSAFAPDGIMWLGYGNVADENGSMTFPAGNRASWEKAGEIHRAFHATGKAVRPQAKLAVLRPYSMRALVCEQEGGRVKNPADALLGEYVRVWSVELGRPYDVFEIPPFETAEATARRDATLKGYEKIVSTEPYQGAEVIGAGTTGQTWTSRQIRDFRQQCKEKLTQQKGTSK